MCGEDTQADGLARAIGERLRNHRLNQGMTVSELALNAGVSPQVVSHAEAGERALLASEVVRLASALDIMPGALLPPDPDGNG